MKRHCWFLGLFFSSSILLASDKLEPSEVIQRFTQKESQFREVWQKYTYKQEIIFQVLSAYGKVVEEQVRLVEVYYTTDGQRKSRVLNTHGFLRSIQVTSEDLEDALSLQPFVLTTEEVPNYKIKYLRKERVDELNTYVFEVKPRKIRKGKRYFKGQIWVDDQDDQIVMSRGKVVPDYKNNKFPAFEAVRQQVDSRFWFPIWIKADDTLRFGSLLSGYRDVRVRQFITFRDFKKFDVKTSIQFERIEEPQE